MASPAITLALLPLDNLAGSPEVDRLARGFAYDLTAELARFPSLGVIAADSVVAALSENGSPESIAARLGAAYLLRGSLRRFGEGLRLNLQLTEAATGRHLWGGRYDGAELPAAQDDIAAKVANALAVRVDQALISSSRRRPPASLAAFECWLLGLECVQRGTAEGDAEGLGYFEQALRTDPHYARAHAGISLAHFNEWSCQAWSKWDEKERLAYEAALRAEALDPGDPLVQMILAKIEQYRREFDHAGPRLDRIRALAPNDANVLIQLAGSYTYQGDPELASTLALRALELNPIPPPWFYCYAALPYFALRRYAEALEVALRAPPGLVVDAPAYRAAAAAYLGRDADAARFLAEFRSDFSRRIACGRELAPEELLRWTLHVNPLLARRRGARSGLHSQNLKASRTTPPPRTGEFSRPTPRRPRYSILSSVPVPLLSREGAFKPESLRVPSFHTQGFTGAIGRVGVNSSSHHHRAQTSTRLLVAGCRPPLCSRLFELPWHLWDTVRKATSNRLGEASRGSVC